MTDKVKDSAASNFLIRGSDYLAAHPDFKLVGRDQELKDMVKILMRDKANSALMVGPGGAGCSAICMGLQAAKDDENMPLDIVSKRLYWLDTDALFSSGDSGAINKSFQKILKTLREQDDTVLIIDDMKDFIEGAGKSGNPHLINALMEGIKDGAFQAIYETRDEDLETVLKSHSDMKEYYTIMDVQEPEAEALKAIVDAAADRLEKRHGIRIAPEAREVAVEMTSKYRARDPSLNRAQPERAITLLDRALTTYKLDAHARPPALEALKARARAVDNALVKGILTPELEGNSKSELETLQETLKSDIRETEEAWKAQRAEIKKCYGKQRECETKIEEFNKELAARLEFEEETRRKDEARLKKERQQREARSLGPTEDETLARENEDFMEAASMAGHETEEVSRLRQKIAARQELLEKNKTEYNKIMAEINKDLSLGRDQILAEFSDLSGIPVNRLTQDERSKLINLDTTLSARVYQQDHAVTKLANAVRVARTGLKDANKPQAAFMFLGPSGVGKTELAKALTVALYDDERAMLRFDMSEYQEKHALAKLIGAPPGYEGYEAGGILTNAIRKNPRCVVLFDEIEKAHPDIFTVFLQILDDARVTDNRGLTASFADAIIIMTTNIGTEYFLDEDMDFEESEKKARADLDKTYRPEMLNRLGGRRNIVCFNRLNVDTIQKIVKREIDKLNTKIAPQGLAVNLPAEELKALCVANYRPLEGARGLVGYIDESLKPSIANTILQTPDAKGLMNARYDEDKKIIVVDPPEPLASNQNIPGAKPPSASTAFKQS